MMKTRTYYEVAYSYSYGLLSTEKTFATDEEAKAWEKIYKTEFPDCRKWYYTDRITTKPFFFFWEKIVKCETIRRWEEEE